MHKQAKRLTTMAQYIPSSEVYRDLTLEFRVLSLEFRVKVVHKKQRLTLVIGHLFSHFNTIYYLILRIGRG